MNKTKECIKDLKESVSNLRYEIKCLRRGIHSIEKEIEYNCFECTSIDDQSLLRQTEQVLLTKIACGVVGHTLKLEKAFVNEKDDNWRHGNFVCTNCFLKVTKRLADKEIRAAEQLGIL